MVPIPGTKRRSYLEENVAADGVELDACEMRTLGEALATGTVSGNRYPRLGDGGDRPLIQRSRQLCGDLK